MAHNIELINEFVETGHARGRRAATTLDFICPTSRCEVGDCEVARRELRDGHWGWVTDDTPSTHIQVVQRSPEIRLVRYTPQNAETSNLELWCFTKNQLAKQPNCSDWEINYPPGKQQLITCTDIPHFQGTNLEPKNKKTRPTPTNSAIELMIDYARERSFSNCWLCQHMPKSMHSSVLSAVPFTKADYMHYNWNNIAQRLQNHSDDCYGPSFPTESFRNKKYEGIAKLVIDQVNAKYLPSGVNITTLLRIIHVQLFTKLGFEYRIQLTLAQTNCSKEEKNLICLPQPYAPAVMAEALVSVLPWIGTRSVDEVKVRIIECTKPIDTEPSNPRNCSQYIPPVLVNELTNVSICFRGTGTDLKKDVGHSHCLHTVAVDVKQTPLPERVYMVCGHKAYTCVPNDNIRGTCYLAYLIPMIRKVATSEIASLYAPLHRHKRTLTTVDKVFGVLVPQYGIYVTQQEVSSLSKVLESHLNKSVNAMLAEHKELTEVKNIALQNRMALDLLLAAQGGVCKVIAATECCAFVSDANQEISDMAHDTEQGVRELHQTYGFQFGDLSSIFGNWGAGLAKLILCIVFFIMMVCFLGSCVMIIIRTFLKKTVKTAIQAPRIQFCPEGGEMTCTIEEDDWRPPVVRGAHHRVMFKN